MYPLRSLVVLVINIIFFFTVGVSVAQTDNLQNDKITAMAWSSDSVLLAIGKYDGSIRVVNVDTGEILFEMVGNTKPIYSLSWHPANSLLAAANYDGLVSVLDVIRGSTVHTFQASQGGFGLTWSLDGEQLIAGSLEGVTLQVWDVESGELILERDDVGSVGQLIWRPDGSALAIANPVGGITILDAETFNVSSSFEVPEPQGQGGDVYSVAWNPTATLLASGSLNGKVRLWDVDTGKILNEFQGNDALEISYETSTIHSVHFSSDEKFLTSVSADGTIRTWDISNGQVVSDMQVDNHISAAVWSLIGGQVAYATIPLLQDETDPFQIVVPYANQAYLKALIHQCTSQQTTQEILTDLVETNQPSALLDTIQSTSESAFAHGCKADLVAVAKTYFELE